MIDKYFSQICARCGSKGHVLETPNDEANNRRVTCPVCMGGKRSPLQGVRELIDALKPFFKEPITIEVAP